MLIDSHTYNKEPKIDFKCCYNCQHHSFLVPVVIPFSFSRYTVLLSVVVPFSYQSLYRSRISRYRSRVSRYTVLVSVVVPFSYQSLYRSRISHCTILVSLNIFYCHLQQRDWAQVIQHY